jgi:diadenosine tetraphosphate (Ap4A) HIT family hydrolase
VKRTLLTGPGGTLVLPDDMTLLASREDGGHLVVLPPRDVWERSELEPQELTQFGFLVAAAARAMLDSLPQLEGGCINYWEAGNWALNDAAEPVGPKTAPRHRHMHLHLLGRSPNSTRPAWRWGESPLFPAFAERHTWSAGFQPLTDQECRAIVSHAGGALTGRYGLPAESLIV